MQLRDKESQPMLAKSRNLWLTLAATALLAIFVSACASASSGPGEGIQGIDVGNTPPPFAMTLTDGTEVSLKDIVDDNQPAHLFWFATW